MPGDSAGMSAAAEYQQNWMHAGIMQRFMQKAFGPRVLPVAGRQLGGGAVVAPGAPFSPDAVMDEQVSTLNVDLEPVAVDAVAGDEALLRELASNDPDAYVRGLARLAINRMHVGGQNPAPSRYPPYKFTATYLVSRYSSMPSEPPSRPKPDCLIPPKGAAAFETIPWLRPTMPVSRPSTTRSARFRSLV